MTIGTKPVGWKHLIARSTDYLAIIRIIMLWLLHGWRWWWREKMIHICKKESVGCGIKVIEFAGGWMRKKEWRERVGKKERFLFQVDRKQLYIYRMWWCALAIASGRQNLSSWKPNLIKQDRLPRYLWSWRTTKQLAAGWVKQTTIQEGNIA